MRNWMPVVIAIAISVSAYGASKVKEPFIFYPLDDELIENAVRFGTINKGKLIALVLKDSGQSFLNALTTSAFNSSGTLSTGFSLQAYTPYAWIAQNASWEAKKYLEFSPDDVTEEMKSSVFRVYANPDTARNLSNEGMKGTSGVEHIVLRTTRKSGFEVAQPLEIFESAQYAQNAFGAKVGFSSMEALFSMEDAIRISSADKKGEFFIVIVGITGEEKKFKVKTKHFEYIP